MHWLYVHAGLSSSAGVWYLFPSGPLSYLTLLSLIAATWAIVRKHNCEVHGCWRVGRHKTLAGHCVCRKHHPDGHLTAAAVTEAHAVAKAVFTEQPPDGRLT